MITFKEEGIASISQDIASVSSLPLESDSLAYFSNGTKVLFREGRIFIGDLLKIYDVETERFLENKTMPFVAWDIEWFNSGGYVFAF